jgi:transposase
MVYVGIDLHKKTIAAGVVDQRRRVLARRTLLCADPARVVAFFGGLGPFQAVVEATASYEWLWRLSEPSADRLVLAHPKKLRVIAESRRKSDKIDAQVLAEFLARDELPESYRPTPRQREHRVLVRHRCYVRRRAAAAKVKIRRVLSDANANRPDLFTAAGLDYLAGVPLAAADRFVVDQLRREWEHRLGQLRDVDRRLKEFAREAPAAEAEARAALLSIPGVGAVTADVVLSELADVRRFRSAKDVAAYAGLAPGFRESAGKRRELPIGKDGSRLLRWALVEAAWRLVRLTNRWRAVFERLAGRRGRRKAIVAVARRLLTVMTAVWRGGLRYRPAAV